MPSWDAADLLQRVKRYAAEPAAVEALAPDATTDAMWYALLTEAEAKWKPILAAHYRVSFGERNFNFTVV